MKVVLKCAGIMSGALSVMTNGELWMLRWFADKQDILVLEPSLVSVPSLVPDVEKSSWMMLTAMELSKDSQIVWPQPTTTAFTMKMLESPVFLHVSFL